MKAYTTREVKWLLENYQLFTNPGPELKSDLVIRFSDLKRAYQGLGQATRDILFMCGVLGMDKYTVGFITGLHKSTVSRQYSEGITWLTVYMNEGG